MDPLSDVLSLLKTNSSMFAGLRAGGDWALRFPAPDGIKFNTVMQGKCWLAVDGEQPMPLQAGDCFLLCHGRPFNLASDPALAPTDALEVYRDARNGIAQCGDAADFFLIGGRFTFCDEAELLLDSLPAVVLINAQSDQASVLRWALERLAHELLNQASGSSLMAEHLAHMMLVQVIRLYQAHETAPKTGWLFALSDPRVNAAIQAIHAEPARRWSVSGLAAVAGASRSTFALHFKRKVGLAPLEYLLRWRMLLAVRDLRNRKGTVSAIAQSLGYDSDSAFSNAFKRVTGLAPREYRERHAHQ